MNTNAGKNISSSELEHFSDSNRANICYHQEYSDSLEVYFDHPEKFNSQSKSRSNGRIVIIGQSKTHLILIGSTPRMQTHLLLSILLIQFAVSQPNCGRVNCAPQWLCCRSSRGEHCCAPQQTCCGTGCCNKENVCCLFGNRCCPSGTRCCNNGSSCCVNGKVVGPGEKISNPQDLINKMGLKK